MSTTRVDCPLVSVIIPAYNAETRIAETLASVIAQDYPNIEIVVVNDCSTDRTAEIARDVLEKSGRPFKLIEHATNRGVSAARNTCISASSGDHICFVDADDILLPTYISRLHRSISHSGTDAAICGFTNRYSNGSMRDTRVGLKEGAYKDNEKITYLRLMHTIETSIVTMMIKKALIKEADIRFIEGCTAGEDVEFQLKVFASAQGISVVDECLYVYVHHEQMGSVRDNDTPVKKLKRYRDNTESQQRTAEYLLRCATSRSLKSAVTDMMQPEVIIRRLTMLSREGDLNGFMHLASEASTRDALRRALRLLFKKPETFFKAASLLLAPNIYYKMRSSSHDRPMAAGA